MMMIMIMVPLHEFVSQYNVSCSLFFFFSLFLCAFHHPLAKARVVLLFVQSSVRTPGNERG